MLYTVTLNPAVDRELTVPELRLDTVLRATAWRVDYGGKGFNVARMLQALGTPAVALALAGGYSGRLLYDGLRSLGIAAEFIWTEGETRTNVSIVSQADGRHIKVNEPGPVLDPAVVEMVLGRVTELARPGDWWVLAGSLPPGLPAETYARLIERIHEAGGRAVLDTSGPALAHGCRARPYLVKPNAEELQQLTGLPVATADEVVRAAQAVQAEGVAHVVVSLGKAGAVALSGAGAWLARSPSIHQMNPVGAGDAMVAGLVWALNRGEDLGEALRWGVACGAAAASLPGTAMGDRGLVERLYREASVERWHV
ncbi:MAG: 1-phosphofructokinase [Caldilineales bacterium]|nr:1-phosphofructokinase [Caldilineales bacterium]MDW8318824.1 1-phosphofructokinase [Anaerolineae bacterium]